MSNSTPQTNLPFLYSVGVLNGLGVLALTGGLFMPFIYARPPADESRKVELPPYDLKEWRALPIQHDGRTKPFESAAKEIVRTVAGRDRLEGEDHVRYDAVAVVLQWMMTKGTASAAPSIDWEKYHFIL